VSGTCVARKHFLTSRLSCSLGTRSSNRSGSGTAPGPIAGPFRHYRRSTFAIAVQTQSSCHRPTHNTLQHHVECTDRAFLHSRNSVDVRLPVIHDARFAGIRRKGLAWSRTRSSLAAHATSHTAPRTIESLHHEVVARTRSQHRGVATELRDMPHPRFGRLTLRDGGHHASQWPAAPNAHVHGVEDTG
jgi:hypothetical protein